MLVRKAIDGDSAPRSVFARAALWLAPALMLLGRVSPAHAEPTPVTQPRCAAAYQLGRENEAAGRLTEAGRQFAACSDSTCDPEIWEACVEASSQVLALLPSIVPFVVDADGTPRTDVRVQIDGTAVAAHLAGVAIPVDPGLHEVSFRIGGRVIASERIAVDEGERSRPLAVSYAASPTEPTGP